MNGESNFPARGVVKEIKDGFVVFLPINSSYELYLQGQYDGPMNQQIECFITAKARKVYTVPSGGNFIVPIFGPPRIIQGRVKAASDRKLVIQAAAPITVELPQNETAIDLDEGAIAVGRMINATLLSGASFELAEQAAAR